MSPQLHVEVSQTADEETWQEDLSRSSYATVFQSYQWSQAYSEALHDIPLYLTVRDHADTVIAQLLLFVTNELERRMSPRYNPILRYIPSRMGVGTRLAWAYGPIIHDKSNATKILESMLDEIAGLAHDWNVTQIYGTSPPLEEHTENYHDAFDRAGFLVSDWATFITDVTRDEETAWNELDKKTRNDIRRGESKITSKEVTDDDLLVKFALLSARFNEVKRGAPDLEDTIRYYRTFWKHLHGSNQTLSPTNKILLAFEGDTARAGLMLNSVNGNVTQHSVLSDGSKSNLGGPLLTWDAIKWAHKFGCKTLDLVGVNPNPSDPEEKGIYFYKSKWGGTFHKQHNLIKVLKPLKVKAFAGYVKVQNQIWRTQGQGRP